MTQYRIFWKPDELNQFYLFALHVYKSEPGLSGEGIYRRAMQSMPKERQRPFGAQAAADMNKWLREHKHDTPLVKPPEQKLETAVEKPVVVEAVTEQPLPPLPLQTAQDTIVDFCVDVIERVLTHPAVLQAANTLVKAAFQKEAVEAQSSAAQWPTSIALARSTKVLVLGLQAREFNDLERNFNGKLVLRYWNADRSNWHLKSMAPTADVVIVMSNRIPHSAENSLRYINKSFVRVSSFDSMKKKLTELAVNGSG